MPAHPDRKVLLILALAAACGAAAYALGSGLIVILGMTAAIAAPLLLARQLLVSRRPGSRWAERLATAALTLVSVGVALVLAEGGLWILQKSPAGGKDGGGLPGIAIPEEWKGRPAVVPGAARANYWHGKLHVYNNDNFRNVGDYRLEDAPLRIVVLGDSLTYGMGIAAEDTYSAVLQALLAPHIPGVRVYNLGVPGYQSADILRVAKKWVPVLKPQVVVYGICLNDLLPSGVGQYDNNMAFRVPLPERLKRPFEQRTLVGQFMTDRYNRLLMAMGIRDDFFADILKDFSGYQTRFAADLKQMNAFVLEQTGRPVLAMVLDQFPGAPDGRGRRIAMIAEQYARDAGMDVIGIEDYYREYAGYGDKLIVSHWEGHPNETANRIFAERFAHRLLQTGQPLARRSP
jgi:hypothetical protein